jgi:hypothetical protein
VPSADVAFEDIAESMKKTAAALRGDGIAFALGGSLAFWARGGPDRARDLDVVVRRDDAERALAALERAGMRPERPPEGWLLKAWDGPVLVDLIWELSGIPDVGSVLERSESVRVASVDLDVISLEDAWVSKLHSFDEHNLDMAQPLRIARAVREQVPWSRVRERTAGSPYAAAFLTLLTTLGVISDEPGGESRPAPRRAVVTRVAPL